MAGGRRRDHGPLVDELEVLDPETGEAQPWGGGSPPEHGTAARSRSQRLRLAARLLLALALALASGAAAGYFAFTIRSLRAVEHEWSEAMALDEARRLADGAIVTAIDQLGDRDDDRTLQAALGRVGAEAAAGLEDHEDALRSRWIPDGKVDALRDEMADALRFRRFQLSPTRRLIGDTPLQRVDAELDRQLDRFGLARSQVEVPTLTATKEALDALRDFADVTTGTVLVALDERGDLQFVDVDGDRVGTRALDVEAGTLLAAGGHAVVVGGGEAVAFRPQVGEVEGPPAWRVAADSAVAGVLGGDVALWTVDGDEVRGVDGDGTVVEGREFRLPAGGRLLAATRGGLVVEPRSGALELWDGGGPSRTIATEGRFAGATADWIAVQPSGRTRLVLHSATDAGAQEEVQLPRTDAGDIVESPDGHSIAFAAGPLAGNIASVLRLRDLDDRWDLVAVGGPRATVLPGTLAWSGDSRFLFWATPSGRIAYADVGTASGTTLRVLLPKVRSVVAVSP